LDSPPICLLSFLWCYSTRGSCDTLFFFFPPVWQASPHKLLHNDVFKILTSTSVLAYYYPFIFQTSSFPSILYVYLYPILHAVFFLSVSYDPCMSLLLPLPFCLLAAGAISRSRTFILSYCNIPSFHFPVSFVTLLVLTLDYPHTSIRYPLCYLVKFSTVGGFCAGGNLDYITRVPLTE